VLITGQTRKTLPAVQIVSSTFVFGITGNHPLEITNLTRSGTPLAMQVAQGLSNKEIAQVLGKSEFTVKNQVSTMLQKLGVPSRGRLIVLLR
jgi:DNA-binding CsgD family transcriptional regulator